MAQDSQVNIRFDESTSLDLTATAKELGISKSQLVRHLTKTFLHEVKKAGGLRIPTDWTRMMGKADARSDWGERKICKHAVLLNDEPSDSPAPEQKPVKYEAKKTTKGKRK